MKKHIKTILFFLTIIFFAGHVFAQYMYIPYYGKNKVIYVDFEWKKYQTDHFDIYYYTENMNMLKKIAEYAESAYLKISQDTKHQLSSRVPLLHFVSSTEMAQTNIYGYLPESVLGVSEPLLYRVAVRGDMSDDELQDLITHELTHIFEFDLLWGSPGGVLYAVAQPPQWIMEGFSEYTTDNWSFLSKMIVRDAVLNDRIPEITPSGHLYTIYPVTRDPGYDFGHSMFEFIEEKYGKNSVRELWQSLKNSSLISSRNPIKRVFNIQPQEFHYEYKKHVREKNKKFLTRENPEDYSLPLGPSYPMNAYYFSFSHALSPSGEVIAVITINVRDNDLDILLLSAKDGSVIRNITRGYTWKYEQIKFEIDPSLGRDLDWSGDGDKIAFFGRAGAKYSLFIVNALTGEDEKVIKIPYDSPSAPRFLAGDKSIIFTAFDKAQRDIFKLDLDTGQSENLTKDDLFEKSPSVSPDGKLIAYTLRIDTKDKIFLSPIDNLEKKEQITFGEGDTISPEFSQDSKKIYFCGDQREAFNIYSIDIESGELSRYTDVRTGNFFPTPSPGTKDSIVFASFNKGAFQVFSGEFQPTLEKKVTFIADTDEEEFERFKPILSFEINKNEIKPYKGIGKLYMMQRPPINTIVSTDGSIYGGSSLSFSDLMGDHNFTIMAYQVRSFRSYYASYTNLKNRLQFMASAFQYTLFYYPNYAYYDPTLFNYLTYQDALATRQIAGANFFAIYPLDRFYRLQGSLAFTNYDEEFYDPYIIQMLFMNQSRYQYFLNGNILSTTLAFIGETTHFKYYGPASGNTFRLSVSQAIPVTDKFLRNTSLEFDYRQYLYLGFDTLFAFRFEGFMSKGRNPFINYYGGNNQVRSVPYYTLVGNEGWYANVEFRFPLVNAAYTLIGQIGPVRGTFFFDITRAKLKGRPAEFYRYPENEIIFPWTEPISFEALGSFGFGLEFFFLGLPIHVDFVKRLEWPEFSKPFDVNAIGGYETKFWIGFDF